MAIRPKLTAVTDIATIPSSKVVAACPRERNLGFPEEGNRGDGRRQDDSVIDKIPEAENALQMRPASFLLRLSSGGHAWVFSFLKEVTFLLAFFLVLQARSFDRLLLGNFCDRDVPP